MCGVCVCVCVCVCCLNGFVDVLFSLSLGCDCPLCTVPLCRQFGRNLFSKATNFQSPKIRFVTSLEEVMRFVVVLWDVVCCVTFCEVV